MSVTGVFSVVVGSGEWSVDDMFARIPEGSEAEADTFWEQLTSGGQIVELYAVK